MLKRPFDDQTQARIAIETRAVYSIINRVENKMDQAIWSTALTLEITADPDSESRSGVARFATLCNSIQRMTPENEFRLKLLTGMGMRSLDAAHVAFAEAARCDFLITCNDRLVRKAGRSNCLIRVMYPIEYVQEVSNG